jgi:YidC/Oxa1 family membrane protein insertase
LLFPLQKKQIKTQIASKKAEPEIKKIKEKLDKATDPAKKQQMGVEMMGVYKKFGVNPFAPLLTMIIQIPILLALY